MRTRAVDCPGCFDHWSAYLTTTRIRCFGPMPIDVGELRSMRNDPVVVIVVDDGLRHYVKPHDRRCRQTADC